MEGLTVQSNTSLKTIPAKDGLYCTVETRKVPSHFVEVLTVRCNLSIKTIPGIYGLIRTYRGTSLYSGTCL